jgi:hypothetical protein
MWEKKFTIVERSINKKSIAIVIYLILLVALWVVNKEVTIFNYINPTWFAVIFIFLITLPLGYILVAGKNYRVIGNLVINREQIKVSSKGQDSVLFIKDIENLKLYLKGTYGEDYIGYIGNILGWYSKDGSGNILEFSVMNKTYRVNLVFENEEDPNALKIIFNEIQQNGLPIKIQKAPFRFRPLAADR